MLDYIRKIVEVYLVSVFTWESISWTYQQTWDMCISFQQTSINRRNDIKKKKYIKKSTIKEEKKVRREYERLRNKQRKKIHKKIKGKKKMSRLDENEKSSKLQNADLSMYTKVNTNRVSINFFTIFFLFHSFAQPFSFTTEQIYIYIFYHIDIKITKKDKKYKTVKLNGMLVEKNCLLYIIIFYILLVVMII